MKPTDDERHEVATRIREMYYYGGIKRSAVFYEALNDVIMGQDGFGSFQDIAARLADLIEPEERTCERGIEMFSHAYPNEIVCDSDCVSTYVFPLTCGHEVELLKNEWPNYCPVCGAKVVDDHA